MCVCKLIKLDTIKVKRGKMYNIIIVLELANARTCNVFVCPINTVTFVTFTGSVITSLSFYLCLINSIGILP